MTDTSTKTTFRSQVSGWLAASLFALIAAIATWSARLVFLPHDPYIEERVAHINSAFERLRVGLTADRERLSSHEKELGAASDALSTDAERLAHERDYIRLLGRIIGGVQAREDSILLPGPASLASDRPAPELRQAARLRPLLQYARTIAWDSAELASILPILPADLGNRLRPLQSLLVSDGERWQALARWSQSGFTMTQWTTVVQAEHAYRRAFHGAVAATVGFRPVEVRFRLPHSPNLQGLTSIEQSTRLVQDMESVVALAFFRRRLAVVGLIFSVVATLMLARFAITGRIPALQPGLARLSGRIRSFFKRDPQSG